MPVRFHGPGTRGPDRDFVRRTTTQPGSGAFVQLATVPSYQNNQASAAAVYAYPVTKGNLLVVCVAWIANSGTNPTVTIADTLGNTWTAAGSTTVTNSTWPSGGNIAIYYAVANASGADTVTATFVGHNCDNPELIVSEYVGFDANEKYAAAFTSAASSLSSGNVTTTQAQELLIGFAYCVGTLTQGTAAAGWQLRFRRQGVPDGEQESFTQASGTYAAVFGAVGGTSGLVALATFYGPSPTVLGTGVNASSHFTANVVTVQTQSVGETATAQQGSKLVTVKTQSVGETATAQQGSKLVTVKTQSVGETATARTGVSSTTGGAKASVAGVNATARQGSSTDTENTQSVGATVLARQGAALLTVKTQAFAATASARQGASRVTVRTQGVGSDPVAQVGTASVTAGSRVNATGIDANAQAGTSSNIVQTAGVGEVASVQPSSASVTGGVVVGGTGVDAAAQAGISRSVVKTASVGTDATAHLGAGSAAAGTMPSGVGVRPAVRTGVSLDAVRTQSAGTCPNARTGVATVDTGDTIPCTGAVVDAVVGVGEAIVVNPVVPVARRADGGGGWTPRREYPVLLSEEEVAPGFVVKEAHPLAQLDELGISVTSSEPEEGLSDDADYMVMAFARPTPVRALTDGEVHPIRMQDGTLGVALLSEGRRFIYAPLTKMPKGARFVRKGEILGFVPQAVTRAAVSGSASADVVNAKSDGVHALAVGGIATGLALLLIAGGKDQPRSRRKRRKKRR